MQICLCVGRSAHKWGSWAWTAALDMWAKQHRMVLRKWSWWRCGPPHCVSDSCLGIGVAFAVRDVVDEVISVLPHSLWSPTDPAAPTPLSSCLFLFLLIAFLFLSQHPSPCAGTAEWQLGKKDFWRKEWGSKILWSLSSLVLSYPHRHMPLA